MCKTVIQINHLSRFIVYKKYMLSYLVMSFVCIFHTRPDCQISIKKVDFVVDASDHFIHWVSYNHVKLKFIFHN